MRESDTHQRLIRSALGSARGEETWATLCSQGATDAEILATLQMIWADGGGTASMIGCTECRADPEPALRYADYASPIWHQSWITGQRLVDLVRETLAIPQPAEVAVEVETGR